MVARLDQRDSGLVAVLGLPAHITHGLVQQDGHLLLLTILRSLVHRDAVGRRDLLAHRGHLPIHAHPTVFDPGIGLTA